MAQEFFLFNVLEWDISDLHGSISARRRQLDSTESKDSVLTATQWNRREFWTYSALRRPDLSR